METNGETNTDFFTENPIFLTESEFPFPENEFPFHEENDRQPEVSDSVPQITEEIPNGTQEVTEEPTNEEMEEIPIIKEEISEEPEEEEENQFTVEAIEGKRKRFGKQEYLVKWLGFSSEENTWEPIDNLNCQELIAEFESKQTPSKRGRKPKAETTPVKTTPIKATPTTTRATPSTTRSTQKKDGFSRGLKAKKVIGVTKESSGELFYSIEFNGSKEVEQISSRVARVKCPQLLIEFLNSKLVFNRKRPREPLENYRPIQSKKFSLFSQPISD